MGLAKSVPDLWKLKLVSLAASLFLLLSSTISWASKPSSKESLGPSSKSSCSFYFVPGIRSTSCFRAPVYRSPRGSESIEVIYAPVSRVAPLPRLGAGEAFFLIQSSSLPFLSLYLTGLKFLNLAAGEGTLTGEGFLLAGEGDLYLPLTGDAFLTSQVLISLFFYCSDLSLNYTSLMILDKYSRDLGLLLLSLSLI